MTPVQMLAAAIVYVCTPGPHDGWDHDIQELLDKRDAAAVAEKATERGSREHREAAVARIGAECRLARALDVPARVAEPIDYDPWPMDLFADLTA
ncbi:hypothetical protein ACIRVF_07950 [Kitasatospora sp. NPDC101157]|uniref:hypothetical protein n=1 Tax=Kitasatospora sp. NPDC101157 TaxID=3364098 RepID=UPI003806979A